jgi:hypothetical protein
MTEQESWEETPDDVIMAGSNQVMSHQERYEFVKNRTYSPKIKKQIAEDVQKLGSFALKVGDFIKKHWEEFDEKGWEMVKYISTDIRITSRKIKEVIVELDPQSDITLITMLGFLREKLDGLILIADDTLTFRSIVSEIRTSRKIVPNSEIMEKVKRLIANGKAKGRLTDK